MKFWISNLGVKIINRQTESLFLDQTMVRSLKLYHLMKLLETMIFSASANSIKLGLKIMTLSKTLEKKLVKHISRKVAHQSQFQDQSKNRWKAI